MTPVCSEGTALSLSFALPKGNGENSSNRPGGQYLLKERLKIREIYGKYLNRRMDGEKGKIWENPGEKRRVDRYGPAPAVDI